MLPLRYWPLPPCDGDVTQSVPVFILKVHSLYSLVLISQDFLFSCLPLCEASVGLSFVLPPLSPLRFTSAISHCQVLATGLDWTFASPRTSTVP
jgi:hypothetical protein